MPGTPARTRRARGLTLEAVAAGTGIAVSTLSRLETGPRQCPCAADPVPGRVQVFKHVLAPREQKLVTHDGYEWLYVLAGELRLILGEREFTLRPGEVAEFGTGEPHWFGPVDASTVEILRLFGPRGDRAVVRTGPSRAR